MKKMYKLGLVILTSVFLLCGCSTSSKTAEEEPNTEKKGSVIQESPNNLELSKEPVSEKIGANLPVSRALAAKMICLAFHDESEIDSMDHEANFTDVKEEDWFYKYVNMMGIEGYMKGTGEEFRPLEPLSLYEAQVLLDKMNPSNKVKIKITEDTKNKPISYTLWCELYQKMLTDLSAGKSIEAQFGIVEKDLIIFSTPATGSLDAWNMATDQGIYQFSGYALDAYVDKKVKFLVKGSEIIETVEVVENTPVLEGAYIKAQTEEGLTIFMGGAERTLGFDGVLDEATPCIADLKLEVGSIAEIAPVNEKTQGVVKKTDGGCIELAEQGELKTRTNVKIYSEQDGVVSWKSIRNLICGTDLADYYMKNGEICAAVIRRETKPALMRIVISQTGFQGYFHENVMLNFQGEYTYFDGSQTKQLHSGDSIYLSNDEKTAALFKTNRMVFSPVEENNVIQIESIKRGNGVNPSYAGKIEVEKRADGFVIVNEVGLEKYLCGVVPSEMPSSYGIEAAKVQAVTARSYAFNQFYANRYYTYGANVDDSTSCQVYNNTIENEISSKGVKQTEGICITYEGEVISTNFFSTSAGSRANSGEVWADMANKAFPAYTPEYASAGKEYKKGDFGDLSEEENAAAFFKDWSIESYDDQSGWFRWKVQMSAEELNGIISKNLKAAYNRNHYLVKTLQTNGTYRSRAITDIGNITEIRVAKRGQGGNAMELIIKGTKAEVLLLTELNIRKVLAPVQPIEGREPIKIQCIHDITMENYSLLPSAFFAIEKDVSPEGSLLSVTFYGGGNGHGVGMSQNGVRGLLKDGFSYDEIIKHYFKGVELEKKEIV